VIWCDVVIWPPILVTATNTTTTRFIVDPNDTSSSDNFEHVPPAPPCPVRLSTGYYPPTQWAMRQPAPSRRLSRRSRFDAVRIRKRV
jgi:hypothetical protein